MRTILLIALFVGQTLAAPVPKLPKSKTDFERLIGTWNIPSAGEGATPYKLFLTEKQAMWQEGEDGPTTSGAAWSIDSTKPVKEINFEFEGGNKAVGIYKFDGEKVTVAFTYEVNNRPTSFDKGETVTVFTMTRAMVK